MNADSRANRVLAAMFVVGLALLLLHDGAVVVVQRLQPAVRDRIVDTVDFRSRRMAELERRLVVLEKR